MAKGAWAHFQVTAQHSHPLGAPGPSAPLRGSFCYVSHKGSGVLHWTEITGEPWFGYRAWAQSHISPTLYCRKINQATAQAQATRTSAIRAPNHYLRQDSKKTPPEKLLLAHTGERKTRIPDARDGGVVKPGVYIELTVPLLPQDGGLVSGWCMGSHLNTKSQCCQSLEHNSFSGIDFFLKDKATGSWSVCSEVPEFRPPMGTHFCKHCSAYTDCFGKPQATIAMYNKESS